MTRSSTGARERESRQYFSSASFADQALIRRQANAAIGRYLAHYGPSFTALQRHLAVELERRMRQCQWLEQRIASMERRINSAAVAASEGGGGEVVLPASAKRLVFQMELLCETYYLVAWRAAECISRLPNLRSFSVVGVRNVRNRLIEHPDKKGGVYEWSTSYVSGIGLKLKPMPREGAQPRNLDAGFWNNVMEFHVEIIQSLSRAQGTSPGPK